MTGDAQVTVLRRAAESVRHGHPWIYRDAAAHLFSGSASRGEIVRIADEDGHFLGTGIWDPESPIAVRVWSRESATKLDAQLFRERLEQALAIRRRLFADGQTTAYRILNGEGDRTPGFVIDRYGDVAVLKVDGDAARVLADQLLAEVEQPLRDVGVTSLLDRSGKKGEAATIQARFGPLREKVQVTEHGVPFVVDLAKGQKTGAFLDQRENRHRIGTIARGRALDCFAYHGSFALHLSEQADEVVALDVSATALERARENARRNGRSNITFVEADAFDDLRARERAGERFDTIVVDPPAFAKNRPSLPAALRGYHEINLRAMRLLAPGGMMFTASCSYHLSKSHFLEMLQGAAADSGRRVTLRELCVQPADHPEVLTIPETGYLKGAILEVND